MIKKYFAFVMTLILTILLIPCNVKAADTEGKMVLYAQIPSDWSGPCVWAWNENGDNAFDAWPGEEMDADKANEGWYYIYLPDWANHVIVNANNAGVQTDEVVLEEGKDSWVTINAADDVSVSKDKATEGDSPEYVEKFAVHVKADASWKNPTLIAESEGTAVFDDENGKAMAEGETGWFTAKAPVTANSITIAANDGNDKTQAMKIDPSEVWVTVEADGNSTFSYVDPEKATAKDVTVHAIVPSDWKAPCLWAWSAPDGTNVYTTWPGEALTQDENGWYTIVIPGWVNSIIVNANEGNIQTTDISVDKEKDLWVVVEDGEKYTLTYEEPAGVSAKGSGSKKAVLPIVGGLALLAVAGAGVGIAKKKKG